MALNYSRLPFTVVPAFEITDDLNFQRILCPVDSSASTSDTFAHVGPCLCDKFLISSGYLSYLCRWFLNHRQPGTSGLSRSKRY